MVNDEFDLQRLEHEIEGVGYAPYLAGTQPRVYVLQAVVGHEGDEVAPLRSQLLEGVRHAAAILIKLVKGDPLAFNELNENCCRMAHAFEELGTERGDLISFMTHNCLEYIYAWLGACKIGCIANPLNFMLQPLEIEFIVNHAGSRFFFVEDALLPQVLEAMPQLPGVEEFGFVKLHGMEIPPPEGWLDLNSLFESTFETSEP